MAKLLVSAGLPTCMEGLTYPIPFSDPDTLRRIALHAEALGYHSVWGNDHMTTQNYVRAGFATPPRFWEPLITYAWLAAATTTLRFGTGILVLPMRRDIVVTAKQIATLDQLSFGRLEIGVGIGAYREEFEALRPDADAHRGAMMEEGMAALRVLFTERTASFDGAYYRFRDVELSPKPLQPKMPFYYGGNSVNHIERVARAADGWIPAAMPPDQLRPLVERLREATAAAGRDPAEIAVAPQYVVRLGATNDEAVARFRRSQMHHHLVSLRRSTLRDQAALPMEEINLIGDPTSVIERAARLKEAGVTHFLGLYFAADAVEELLDQMQWFAEAVTPKIV
jgi:probable F420-dependent oxidoreductase